MRFRLLGAVQVDDDEGRLVDVSAFKLRSLLAFLLLHANEVVTRDAVVDAIWNGKPPPSANHGLDVLISRLRRLLGDASERPRLRTVPGGYLLEVLPAELDVDRFENGVEEGRDALYRGQFTAAVELLSGALHEWHGAALGDVAYQSFAVARSALLEELRVDATEDLLDAELRLGHHVDVLPVLESLVASNPLRERARAQLMLALYRAGRHAEALETYRAGRQLLAEEQGLEPGEELRQLHVQILRQDKSLNRLDRGHDQLDETPPTRYAQNRNGAIAYQTSGDGLFDLLYVPSFVTNVELAWRIPTWASLLARLGAFSRLIRFDKRGTGMSDRGGAAELPTLVDDVRAVMDAAASPQAAVFATAQGGALATLFAAAHPERVWALVLWGTAARVTTTEDYPIGIAEAELEHRLAEVERIWTEPGYAEAVARALGSADPLELAAMWRQSACPGAVSCLARQELEVDIRDVLPSIAVPTLVLDSEGADSASSAYLAEHVPGARHAVFRGAQHLLFEAIASAEPIVAEIEAFLTDAWAARNVTSVVAGIPRRRGKPVEAPHSGLAHSR